MIHTFFFQVNLIDTVKGTFTEQVHLQFAYDRKTYRGRFVLVK